MNKDELLALQTGLSEKHARHKELLTKLNAGEGTQEESIEAQGLVTEMREIHGKIVAEKERSAALADMHTASTEIDAFLNTPDIAQGLATLKGLGTMPNGVTVLGFRPESNMYFQKGIDGKVKLAEGLEDVSYGKDGGAKAFKACKSKEYMDAMLKYIRTGDLGALMSHEQKTLQEGADISGGFLAPEEILARLISKEPTPTRVQNYVQRITTGRDQVSMPKVRYATDDLYTTGMRVTWTGESPSSSTQHRVTDPVFGTVNIPIYTAMMSIPITNDLVEDSMIDIIAWLVNKFGETYELLRDNMILNGSGLAQPSGILANPDGTDQPASVVSGSASLLTGDGLINLTEAIPEQYDDNSILIFNKTNTGKAIRLLKDGEGRPLVSYGFADNGLASGRYKEVNGYPYIWSGFMPNVATGTFPIIFGDLRGYILADRVGFSIRVLDELYAETNQRLILGRVRFGGVVAEDYRMRVQKVST